MNKEEKEEFDILVELGVLQKEVRKVDKHIHNNYKKKIYKLEKIINKAIKYCELNKEFTPRLEDIENILKGENNE